MTKGLFITLEGIEGVGKTTHALFIEQLLKGNNQRVILTREPGGTTTGEAIRQILLNAENTHLTDLTELLLIFSARAQHLQEVIQPAIQEHTIVLCDRFTDATYAYQGGGRKMDWQQIQVLEALVQQGMKPDLTILLDAPVKVGMERAKNRSDADRFESETVSFFERVRQAYLDLAAQEPQRIHIVDANQPLEQVQGEIATILAGKGLC